MPEEFRAADLLPEFRKRHRLSRAKLAELLEIPHPKEGGKVTVARWEAGTQEPAPYLWRALEHLEGELTGKDSD